MILAKCQFYAVITCSVILFADPYVAQSWRERKVQQLLTFYVCTYPSRIVPPLSRANENSCEVETMFKVGVRDF